LLRKIVVRLTHFAGGDPEPGRWLGRRLRRGIEDFEAALEQFREIASDLADKMHSEKMEVAER
jgi:hypothetical protein